MKTYKEQKEQTRKYIVDYVKEHDFETNSAFYYEAMDYSFEDAIEIGINVILKEGRYIDDEIYDNIQIMLGCESNGYTAGTIQRYINSIDDEYLISMLGNLKSVVTYRYDILGITLYDY